MEYDFEIISIDRKSKIKFTLEEYIHEISPSISCSIDIEDQGYRGWNINKSINIKFMA